MLTKKAKQKFCPKVGKKIIPFRFAEKVFFVYLSLFFYYMYLVI